MARPATIRDATQAIEVVRQSITILCAPDHHNDPVALDQWLANKKTGSFEDWISNPDNFCAVGELDGKVQGVGLLQKSGHLLLFYVAPGYERRGLGRSIHGALMAQAALWGLEKIHLESTSVARRFYESLGYKSSGPQKSWHGILQVFPYEKTLSVVSFNALITSMHCLIALIGLIEVAKTAA